MTTTIQNADFEKPIEVILNRPLNRELDLFLFQSNTADIEQSFYMHNHAVNK